MKKADSDMGKIAEIMKEAGMEVKSKILKENEVSIALIRQFKRVNFDDLSYKNDAVLPVDVERDL